MFLRVLDLQLKSSTLGIIMISHVKSAPKSITADFK